MSGPYLEGKRWLILNFHDTITEPGLNNLPEKKIGDYWIDVLGMEELAQTRDRCMEYVRMGDSDPRLYDAVTEQFLKTAKGKPLSEEIALEAGVQECVSDHTREAIAEADDMGIDKCIASNCPEEIIRWSLGEKCAEHFRRISGNRIYCEDGICVDYEIRNNQQNKTEKIDQFAKSLGIVGDEALCVGKYPLDAGTGMELAVVANGNHRRRFIADDQGIPTINRFSDLLARPAPRIRV